MKTVRQIAKEQFDKIPIHAKNATAWHWWKRAYDSAANHLEALNAAKNEFKYTPKEPYANHPDLGEEVADAFIANFQKPDASESIPKDYYIK